VYTSELNVAIEAVALASIVCRRVQARLEHVRAITKDDRSPVTIADFASQAVVSRTLARLTGLAGVEQAPLVGEESSTFLRDPAHRAHLDACVEASRVVWPDVGTDGLLDSIDRGATRRVPDSRTFWTLDPVDGTKGFLRGQQYAVALAFIRSGKPVLGVLGCPNLPSTPDPDYNTPDPSGGVILCAVSGGGAFERPCPIEPATLSAQAAPRPVRCSSHSPGAPVRACESAESAHSDHSSVTALMNELGPAGAPARLDSQCKYAVVARGQADAYLRLPTSKCYVEKIWDHAAGALIAAEAGAIVTDIRGLPLDFGRGATLSANAGIICAGAEYHGALLDAARRLGLGD